MSVLIIVLMFLAGICLAVQAPINAAFAKKAGSLESAMISFLIGAIFLGIVVIFFGKFDLITFSAVPKWQLLCAVCGLTYVVLSIITVPKIGVGIMIISVIVGQIVTGIVIDHFGLFGNQIIGIDAQRMLGIVLLLASLYFMLGNKSETKESRIEKNEYPHDSR